MRPGRTAAAVFYTICNPTDLGSGVSAARREDWPRAPRAKKSRFAASSPISSAATFATATSATSRPLRLRSTVPSSSAGKALPRRKRTANREPRTEQDMERSPPCDDPPRRHPGARRHIRPAPTARQFERLDPFIARGLSLMDSGHLRGLVLLLRIDHTGAGGRAAILNRAEAIWTCCWRPTWIPGTKGNGRWWCVWVLWLPGVNGATAIRFLEPAELRAAGVWPAPGRRKS